MIRVNSKTQSIINSAIKFTNIELAKMFIKDANKPMDIINGNDGYLWIVTMSEANMLINNGYELIK